MGREVRTTSLAKLWSTPNWEHFSTPCPTPTFLPQCFPQKSNSRSFTAYLFIKGDAPVSIGESLKSPYLPYPTPQQVRVWRNLNHCKSKTFSHPLPYHPIFFMVSFAGPVCRGTGFFFYRRSQNECRYQA